MPDPLTSSENQSPIGQVSTFAKALVRAFRIRLDRSKIDDLEKLCRFASTRAAYVAQTSLYGYLKARMGRDYVLIFKDEAFAPSLNQAKWEVYAACLSDLMIYACASVVRENKLDDSEAAELANYCMRSCVDDSFVGSIATQIAPLARENFAARVNLIHWPAVCIGSTAFSTSPRTLAEASPVSQRFRELDREIVENSVRFRWNDVREQLRRRLDPIAVCRNWKQISGSLIVSSSRSH